MIGTPGKYLVLKLSLDLPKVMKMQYLLSPRFEPNKTWPKISELFALQQLIHIARGL